MRRLAAGLLLGAAPRLCVGADIQHVVLLIMENRPTDHFFGWAQEELPGINGLTGKEFNYYKVGDPSKGQEPVRKGKANYICKDASDMSYPIFKDDFFGPGVWNGTPPYPEPHNDGYLESNDGNAEVMWQFAPEQIPVKMALAKEFALVDGYYSSFPGPSTPNHLFLHSATSAGCTETGATYRCQKGATFPQKTIYQNLLEANLTWAYFYNDSSWNHYISFFNTPEGKAGVRTYDEFYARAREGTLPNFSWISPRQGKNQTTGEGSNDDHPCHDIALGERLIKDTYEALRAGAGWNRTLFLITWDDAGGWYDHAPPVVGVPRPDDEPSCPDRTDFTWSGGRVPMFLISPWVPKGKVIHGPAGEPGTAGRPFANSIYEHSSLSATLKNIFGLANFLTRRDAWAGSFHAELTESTPRVDTPMHLPEAPPPSPHTGTHGGCGNQLTRRQKRRIHHWADLNNVDVPEHVWAPDAAEQWINEQFRDWLACPASASADQLAVAV